MRKYIILFVLMFSAITSFAENASNARVQQKGYLGDTVIITYDLSTTSTVRLLVSTNMSNDFKEVKKVTGAVGKNVQAGANRQITWNVLEEYDRFVADGVRFKVEAVDYLPLTVSHSQVNTGAKGKVDYIAVTCSEPWEILQVPNSMYTVKRTGDTVKIVVSANKSTSVRKDMFHIRTLDGTQKVEISLLQAGKSVMDRSSRDTKYQQYIDNLGLQEVTWYSMRASAGTAFSSQARFLSYRIGPVQFNPFDVSLDVGLLANSAGSIDVNFVYMPSLDFFIPFKDDAAAYFGGGPTVHSLLSSEENDIPFKVWMNLTAGVHWHWGLSASSDFFIRYNGNFTVGLSLQWSTDY